MYTKATKNFGIWRENHGSGSRFRGKPSQSLVVALGSCAFLAWLIFFVVLKFRGDFFVVEDSPVELISLSEIRDSRKESRRAALSVAVFPHENHEVKFLFNTGDAFRYPSEEALLHSYIEKRTSQIELLSMLTRLPGEFVSRIQIWPDKRLSFSEVQTAIQVFSRFGFDDFDIAVEGRMKP